MSIWIAVERTRHALALEPTRHKLETGPELRDPEGRVPLQPDKFAERVLICNFGGRRVAVPEDIVERIVPIAEITPLVGAPTPVVGVLNYHGQVLPVVDPRPAFGMATPPISIDQQLLVINHSRRFLLWVDSVERIDAVTPVQLGPVSTLPERSVTPSVLRLIGEVIPVLAPLALYQPEETPMEQAIK